MKVLCRFLLLFAVLFGLLGWPWPGQRQVVGAFFRMEARFALGVALPKHSFRVESVPDPQPATLDTRVIVADNESHGADGAKPALTIAFDSVSLGWIPLAMFLALVVATPLLWIKRLKALVVGALVTELIVAATIAVNVSYSLATTALPAWERSTLMFANHLLMENLWFSFVPPFLLWATWLAWGGHWRVLAERMIHR